MAFPAIISLYESTKVEHKFYKLYENQCNTILSEITETKPDSNLLKQSQTL